MLLTSLTPKSAPKSTVLLNQPIIYRFPDESFFIDDGKTSFVPPMLFVQQYFGNPSPVTENVNGFSLLSLFAIEIIAVFLLGLFGANFTVKKPNNHKGFLPWNNRREIYVTNVGYNIFHRISIYKHISQVVSLKV